MILLGVSLAPAGSGLVQNASQALTSPDASYQDNFGWAVDRDNGTTVVGAWGEGPSLPEIGYGDASGAAYVFGEPGGVQKLTASDGQPGDVLGKAVAISEDIIVVGAEGADHDGIESTGAAYVFQRGDDGHWQERAKILPPAPTTARGVLTQFGTTVDVHGETIIVGVHWPQEACCHSQPSPGAVYVYEWTGTSAHLTQVLEPDSPLARAEFGAQGISVHGDVIAVGAPLDEMPGASQNPHGAVYVFERGASNQWVQTARVMAPWIDDVVYAPVLGWVPTPVPVCTPEAEAPCLTQSGRVGFNRFGFSVDVYEDTLVVGEPVKDLAFNGGGVHVFERAENGTWAHVQAWRQYLHDADGAPPYHHGNTQFGFSVSAHDGGFVVGDPGHDKGAIGEAYLFARTVEGWSWQRLQPTDGRQTSVGPVFFTLGFDVAYDGDAAVVGYPQARAGGYGEKHAGAAYVFRPSVSSGQISGCIGGQICL